MFTGIVTSVGRVVAIDRGGDTGFVIETDYDPVTIDVGASIAHNGVCLTVVQKTGPRYTIQASTETLSKTTLGNWQVGTEVNLERSLRLGDELGGHLVFGHVDAVARVVGREPEGDSVRFQFEAPDALSSYFAPKGSVALDGVSLTVNEVDGARFGVNIIPHTLQCTTFRTLKIGDPVNLEVDMLARYVARMIESHMPGPQAIATQTVETGY